MASLRWWKPNEFREFPKHPLGRKTSSSSYGEIREKRNPPGMIPEGFMPEEDRKQSSKSPMDRSFLVGSKIRNFPKVPKRDQPRKDAPPDPVWTMQTLR